MQRLKGVGSGRPGRRAKFVAMAVLAACFAVRSRQAKGQAAQQQAVVAPQTTVQKNGRLQSADAVTVTGTLPESVGLTKFTEPVLDTPQTVVEVPKFILNDEQNRTLQDALRNVPGISLAAGESGAQGDNLTIRGFTARNDIDLDGIRDFGSYYRDSFNIDEVEVLEGPAGV